MARIAMRRFVAALTLVLAAGCASSPGEKMPHLVAIRLEEQTVQLEKNRMVLKRILGRDNVSLGQMMAECVEDELNADGIEARSPGVASRGTRDEALAALRADGEGRALLVVRVGAWDLESMDAAGKVTVEYEFLLFDGTDGHEIWNEAVSRRTVTLRTGENRDIEAFVRRLTVESLRGRP